MISTLHLHRRSSRIVAFIGRDSFTVRDRRRSPKFSSAQVHPHLYPKFLNKRAGASTFIMESTAVTTHLIRSINKFDGTAFVEWHRTLRAMTNLVHPEISEILNSQLRPELLYRTRRGRGRPTTRGVATSSSALAGAMESEEPTPGREGIKGKGQHEEISSVTIPSMATVPSTDELTLANRAELVQWDAYNKQLHSVLFLCTKGAANNFLVRFAGRPGWSQQPDGQAAWRAMGKKYLSSSMQRRRLLMHKLNGMTMTRNQYPDEYLTQVFHQRDELEHVGETFTEARMLDIILEDLSDEYEPIRFAAERDPEISLKKMEFKCETCTPTASRAVTARRFLREKGRQSAMTASS